MEGTNKQRHNCKKWGPVQGFAYSSQRIYHFSAFGSLRKFRDLALFYFESPQPPIVLNAIINQTSENFVLELFTCNIQRRSPRNSGKMGSKFVVHTFHPKFVGRLRTPILPEVRTVVISFQSPGHHAPQLSLSTSFMSPIPPASPGRVLEKGERLGDDGLAILVVAWTANSEFYLSKLRRSLINSSSISLDDIDKLEAILIPREHVYPLWRKDVTEVQTPLPSDIFIKINQGLVTYDGTSSLVDLINAEIDIMEILMKKSHPNICKYYGCMRDGDYIVGICLQKYNYTLQDIIDAEVPVDQ